MTELASQHAGMDVDELVALTVRVPRKLKRDFALMCAEMGVSQQFMVGVCLASALRDYDRIKDSVKWEEQQ